MSSLKTTYHNNQIFWKKLLKEGLCNDQWDWDWTTLGALSQSSNKKVTAAVVAKSEGIWVGEGLLTTVADLSHEMGLAISVKHYLKDGEKLKPGKPVCTWTGPARAVLAFERPFLNLASYASGIASATFRLVEIVRETWKQTKTSKNSEPPRITATRKILPFYRDLCIWAVKAGGGYSHRVNLAGGVLIKENHIATAGSIRRAIYGAKQVAPHGLKIEVEVTSVNELSEAVEAGAGGVLLDNFNPGRVKEAIRFLGGVDKKVFIEVSGGINEKTVSGYVMPGVDIISAGGITHSVRSIDLSMLIGIK